MKTQRYLVPFSIQRGSVIWERTKGTGRDSWIWALVQSLISYVTAALTSSPFTITNLQNGSILRPTPGLLVRKWLIIVTGTIEGLGKCWFSSHSAFLNKAFKNTTKEKRQYGPSRDLLYTILSYRSMSVRLRSLICWVLSSCSFQIILNKELSKLQKLNLDTRRC